MSKEGWKQHKLRELVDDVAMGPFGSNLKVDNFIAQGVPVIRGGNLNVGGLKDEYFAFVSEEKANSLKRSLAYPDDLVFKGKLEFILAAANYIEELTSEKEGKVLRNGKERFKENVVRLQQAFGLAVPHPKAIEIRDDLALFQAIKARFAKFDDQTRTRTNQEIETAIRQIINDAIISEEVVDVFDAAGIKKPDISILSDEFLAEIQGMKRQNLGLELLKRLLNDEIKTRGKTNLVQGRKFSEMLADAVKRYQSGLIDSAKMIDELIRLAKDIREADKRGEKMNLRPDEIAFYDALADNPTAEAILGDYTLKLIAHELVDIVQKNTSIDWQVKESVQAKLRVLVKRILRKYKYPPDDQTTGEYTVSVTKVLDQAEALADFWSGNEGSKAS